MKVVISSLVFAAVAIAAVVAAPTLTEGQLPEAGPVGHQIVREKRSSYGVPYLAPAPCASASYSAIPPSYHAGPVQHAAYAPHGYGYGAPQYREVDEEQEMMSFSDMDAFMSEHVPMARYGYQAPAVAHYGGGVAALGAGVPAVAGLGGIAGHLVAPSASGPVFGVFPNAKTGGCSVPLLLSCSPTVVPGRIVNGQPQYAQAHDAYRGVDEQMHHQLHEQAEDHSDHELSSLSSGHEAAQVNMHQ